MRNIIFIIGLPGSGKTCLATSFSGTLIDDIGVDTENKIKNVTEDSVIITDPMACYTTPDKVYTKLEEWFGDCSVEFVAFENNPEQCWRNIQNRDSRIISKSFIDDMSKAYDPYIWNNDLIKVWGS